MKQAVFVGILCIALICLMSHTVAALRCSGKIVSRGDTRWHVRDVCGEPGSIDIHQEEIAIHKKSDQHEFHEERIIYIDYEIWRYKFSSQSLAYILIFRDHVLIDEMTEAHYRGYWRQKRVYE